MHPYMQPGLPMPVGIMPQYAYPHFQPMMPTFHKMMPDHHEEEPKSKIPWLSENAKEEPNTAGPSQKPKAGENEEIEALLDKIKKLEADKTFYEEALETRTNQLEEMEQRCEQLEQQLSSQPSQAPKLSQPSQEPNPRIVRQLEEKVQSLEEQLAQAKGGNQHQERAYSQAMQDLDTQQYKLDQVTSEKGHIERELTALKQKLNHDERLHEQLKS